MGFWGNMRTALLTTRAEQRDADRESAAQSATADTDRADTGHDAERKQGQAKYARQKAAATAAGQTAKGYRAGYIGAEETKTAIENLNNSIPELKIVRSPNGLDLALHDGRLIDYKTLALRRWSIFGFRIMGMSYYEDPEKPFIFRLGQPVALKREPKNEFDPNAVAITIGKSSRKVGYVNKQRARWIAAILDAGGELSGIVIQTKVASPRILVAPAATLETMAQGAGTDTTSWS
jgi:hypothetical protein